jgi:hypothetical protein
MRSEASPMSFNERRPLGEPCFLFAMAETAVVDSNFSFFPGTTATASCGEEATVSSEALNSNVICDSGLGITEYIKDTDDVNSRAIAVPMCGKEVMSYELRVTGQESESCGYFCVQRPVTHNS